MPWAAWVIAALLAVVWVPVIGQWFVNAIIMCTLLPISLFSALLQKPSDAMLVMSINDVARDQSASSRLAGFLGDWGWPGASGLQSLSFCALDSRRMRARRSVRGLANALILVGAGPFVFGPRWRPRAYWRASNDWDFGRYGAQAGFPRGLCRSAPSFDRSGEGAHRNGIFGMTKIIIDGKELDVPAGIYAAPGLRGGGRGDSAFLLP